MGEPANKAKTGTRVLGVGEIDMADNSSFQSNGDKPFSVDIDDYDDADVVAFGTVRTASKTT